MRRTIMQIGIVPALVVGCASAPGPETEVLLRSPRIVEAFQAEIAIAPTAHLQPVAGSAEISARFSNALYIESMTQWRGVAIASPEFVLERLGAEGESTLESFRQVRRDLVRDDSPDPGDLARLLATIRHRYLFVTWVEESEETGMEELAGDLTEMGYSQDARRAKYAVVQGLLWGALVDLQNGEPLWRGVVDYESEKRFGVISESERSDVDEARAFAAYRLIDLVLGRS